MLKPEAQLLYVHIFSNLVLLKVMLGLIMNNNIMTIVCSPFPQAFFQHFIYLPRYEYQANHTREGKSY